MLKEVPFANALAVVVGVLALACGGLAIVAPGVLRGLGQSWFHAYDLSAIPAAPVSGGGVLVGLIAAVGLGWIFGYALAWTYNQFSK